MISTSSGKNRDFVIAMGADEHIDYREQKFEEVLSDIDFVLDTLGGEMFMNCLKVLKNGGGIISIAMTDASEEAQAIAGKRSLNIEKFLVTSNGKDMNVLKEMLADGSLKPHVSKTFAFAELPEAHTYVEAGRTVGKVVVTL